MMKIENWCVGCRDIGLPCLGYGCPNRQVEVHYCDKCGTELDERNWYNDDPFEYCDDCMELEDDEDEEI